MTAPEAERWAAIPGRPGYEASTLGRIRSMDRTVTHKNGRQFWLRGRVLVTTFLPSGYEQTFTGGGNSGYVHRMVLEAFVGPCPPGMEGCHKNCNNRDNRLSNLRWDTPAGNAADTLRLGRKKEQKKTHCPQGHRLAQPNLVQGELPNRKCKACNRTAAWVQRGGDPVHRQAISDAYYQQILKEAA